MFTVDRLAASVQLALIFVWASSGNAQESWRSLPEKNEPLRIGFGILENGSVGSYRWSKVDPPNPSARKLGALPGYGYLKYEWDGEYLKAHPLQDNSPKHVVEKDGWYLTGDYSTDPPRVVLTKDKTKYSKWTFEVGKTSPEHYYLRNFNVPKGDPYLKMKETGARTPLGPEWEAIILDIILTNNSDEKTELYVDNLKRNNGK